jgi:uncharacterized protein (DUF362 family)
LRYPDGGEFYSPSNRTELPEYKFAHRATCENGVYEAVRTCLVQAGLDAANVGTSQWNPLRAYIRPGNKVFVLCNFVKHNDQSHDRLRFSAKCTHGSVLRAVLDYVLLALGGQGSVAFGNAPLQSCDWPRVIRETGADRVEQFYRQQGPGMLPVRAVDLRGHVVRQSRLGGLSLERHAEDSRSVAVDLGRRSLLETFFSSHAAPKLRVLDYDPRRTERCHAPGKHVYLISREILEADVVLSLPKLKTHEKVGITCGIKGCVGTVAHKDCLAHHRLGSPSQNGDEYPNHLRLLSPLSALHEFANRSGGSWVGHVAQSADALSRKVVRRFTRSIGGSWQGNDTCWRMAVDLARIVSFANLDGHLGCQAQRQHLMITDGIVAGEGNGPLSCTPVELGYLAFADNVVCGDYANCVAMGFAPERLPMIQEAMHLQPPSLLSTPFSQWDFRLNGRSISLAELGEAFPRAFAPPQGWRKWFSENSDRR